MRLSDKANTISTVISIALGACSLIGVAAAWYSGIQSKAATAARRERDMEAIQAQVSRQWQRIGELNDRMTRMEEHNR
jgi:hypothetical protein